MILAQGSKVFPSRASELMDRFPHLSSVNATRRIRYRMHCEVTVKCKGLTYSLCHDSPETTHTHRTCSTAIHSFSSERVSYIINAGLSPTSQEEPHLKCSALSFSSIRLLSLGIQPWPRHKSVGHIHCCQVEFEHQCKSER